MSPNDKELEHFESDPVIRSGDGTGDAFAKIVARRLSRRDLLKTGLAAAAGAVVLKPSLQATAMTETQGLNFTPLTPQTGDQVQVPEGYSHQVLLKWGDPIRGGAPEFDAHHQTSEAQDIQFGYNCDFVGFLPLPVGSKNSRHGLLCVNHEYINPELMFSNYDRNTPSAEQVDIMMSAVGFSVTEIVKRDGTWSVIKEGDVNRRFTAHTPFLISGPAAGTERMKTTEDPDGRLCRGTFANCSAGTTPWGTVLSGEENFQSMFGYSELEGDGKHEKSNRRYGLDGNASGYRWENHKERFDCRKNPNGPNHFGWVIEIDPYDEDWVPRKRTALGRIRHEAATTFVSKNDLVVMYSGDDARFEYVYKFVAANRFDREDRKANRDLMDEGVLYVAKFNDDGSGIWLPLVFGQGPLTPENGFDSQADVVIDARIASDLLGATKMDRPEDMEVNPVNKKLYIACTNNSARGVGDNEGATPTNPRDENKHGHIVELTETDDDHGSTTFDWELFIVCGDPEDEETYFAGYPKDQVAGISCPDNLCFDRYGNLWIATDGQTHTLEVNDGMFAVPVSGAERGRIRQFMSAVTGAEVCGPEFTPDNTTLFLAIQHPGERSTFDNPSTHWPGTSGPPRPSVIAISADHGRAIGS